MFLYKNKLVDDSDKIYDKVKGKNGEIFVVVKRLTENRKDEYITWGLQSPIDTLFVIQ